MSLRRAVVALAAVAVAAPLAALTPSAPAAPGVEPQVVVAVADSGINPYHEVFRRPDLTAHPCTYVEGYDDCSVPALDLSIGEHASYADAVAADAAVWASVVPGQWYWIPGTSIIGAVCDGGVEGRCILDENGHGTGTSSNVLSEAPDALVMMHEGLSGSLIGTAPVTPDVMSYSVGRTPPLPEHLVDPVIPGPAGCGQLPPDRDTIFFRSAGNNAPVPSIADCIRTYPHMHAVGGGYPDPPTAATQSYSVYDFASWFCRPVARAGSLSAQGSACGTSFATPTAAGAAAAALLEIRRQEGYTGRNVDGMVSSTVTHEAFVAALRAAASYDPDAKFPHRGSSLDVRVPAAAPWLLWGYGWLDSTVTPTVVDCVLGGPCPTKSEASMAWNGARAEVRHRTTDDVRVLPEAREDDAGSGADAPDQRDAAVAVASGEVHGGHIDVHDADRDWYVVATTAGDDVELRAQAGLYGRFTLVAADGTEVARLWCDAYLPCATSVDDVPGGLLHLEVSAAVLPQDYAFSVGVGEPAGTPTPLG